VAQENFMRTDQVAKILGGKKLLKREIHSVTDLRELIHAGLPTHCFIQMLKIFSLPQEEAARALGIPMRTMTRRFSQQARLTPIESEKAIRLARAFARAEEVFDNDQDKVTQWFRRPNRALGGEAPLAVMDSDLGAVQVEEILGRIQEGIFG
jgi:putative toxin-antitoxin system antitoxin component (TIGR02293 family)